MTLEEAMIEHCAPTLAGVKSAGLFRFSPQEPGRFARQFREWRGALDRRGLNLLVLKRCRRTGAYLLYIYRESVRSRELAAPQVRTYLAELGYHAGGECRALLRQLAGRLCFQEEFPHEIGLFLGYPLEDVKGFIQNKGQGYACCGLWKSYGDPRAARRYFDRCRACTAAYKRRYAAGVPLERLIVAA